MNLFKHGALALTMMAGLALPLQASEQTKDAKPTPAKATTEKTAENPLENQLVIKLKSGDVVLQMLPKIAPNHVARMKKLAREKFFDGIVFHRVIGGFMAQTGDPTGTGMGGSKYPDLKAEFSKTPFVRGTVGMARSAMPHSANSQFFIMFARSENLDEKYTVWAKVIKGMEHVDKIKKGDRYENGAVIKPDKMISVRVAADLK